MFGGQSSSGFGMSGSPGPFAFGQQPNTAPAPTFGQAAPAFGQGSTAIAPTFSGSLFGAPAANGFAAGTSSAPAARRKVVRRGKK